MRSRRPSTLRVAATLAADAAALIITSFLAAWIAVLFDGIPLVGSLSGPFESDPYGGLLLFVCLTPFWLAALWVFGLLSLIHI